LLELWE